MENLGNFEKVKENLLCDFDNIIDEKRALFEQIKNLEKEEYLIKNNIIFFENYIRLLDGEKSSQIDINDFMNIIPKENIVEKRINKKYAHANSGFKKKDLIEENIKAFDEAHNYVYEHEQAEIKQVKIKKKEKEKEKEKEIINNTMNEEAAVEVDEIKRNYDENYFVNIIKRNFES